MSETRAEIFDLGYQPYEGERTTRRRRRAAIWRDGVRLSLGLGRGAAAKVAPWLLIALALVPMAVLVVVSAVMSEAQEIAEDFELPSFAEYYEFAILPLGLFAAVVAPLMLCPDRRDGVLSLYAARPITPTDYFAARWLAFFTVLACAAWLPEAVLFGWSALDASSPGDWLTDNWDLVPRFLLAGVLVSAVFTTLALLAASFTARRAYASVGTLAVIVVGTAIGEIADEDFEGQVSDAVALAALPHDLVDAIHWVFGGEPSVPRAYDGSVYFVFLVALTVVLGVVLWHRTRTLVRE